MKTLTKLLSAAAIAAGSLGVTAVASADVSYNVGYVLNYSIEAFIKEFLCQCWYAITRERFLCGMDRRCWRWSRVRPLCRVRYGHREVSVGVGFTGYYYTDDWDETYEEVNLSVGYGPVSIGYSIGEWDGNGGEDYDFPEHFIDLGKGFYGTYGTFGDDFDGITSSWVMAPPWLKSISV